MSEEPIPRKDPHLSKMQRLNIAVLVLTVTTLFTYSILAYEGAGHYYTIVLIMKDLLSQRLSEEQSSLVAFCAQLPDIAEELDAIEVYKSAASNPIAWAAWGWNDKVLNRNIGQMIEVQQFLHGLTGGKSDEVRKVAEEIVKELSDKIPWKSGGIPSTGDTSSLCALGFALHLYGDSFAHRQLDKPESMYPTGRGHFGDGVRPDRPLFSSFRTQDYLENYLVRASGYLGDFTLGPSVKANEMNNEVKKLQTGGEANGWNDYGEVLLRDLLIRQIDKNRTEDFVPPLHEHKTSPCNRYIKKIFVEEKHFKHLKPPKCEVAWSRFRDKAKSLFELDRHRDAFAPEWRNLQRNDPQF